MSSGSKRLGDLLPALCIEWLILRLRSTAWEAELVDRNLKI